MGEGQGASSFVLIQIPTSEEINYLRLAFDSAIISFFQTGDQRHQNGDNLNVLRATWTEMQEAD